MKNFLIIVLAVGLSGAAFMTRPDKGEFEQYVRERRDPKSGNDSVDRIMMEVASREALDNVEFKDFYLWTVVQRDGKTIYTGVFDRWIDNEQIRRCLPS